MCILGLAKRPQTDATTRCTSTVQNQTQKKQNKNKTKQKKDDNGNGLWSASLANRAPSEMLEGS
jgi:hypothetical protein